MTSDNRWYKMRLCNSLDHRLSVEHKGTILVESLKSLSLSGTEGCDWTLCIYNVSKKLSKLTHQNKREVNENVLVLPTLLNYFCNLQLYEDLWIALTELVCKFEEMAVCLLSSEEPNDTQETKVSTLRSNLNDLVDFVDEIWC